MKLRTQLQIFFIAGIVIISGSTFAQKKWPGIVLYSLDRNVITGNMVIDPVVRISKGQFSYPVPIPPETWDNADKTKILGDYFDRFCREEYPRGRNLEMLVDGNKCGRIKITEPDTLNSCSPDVSEVHVTYTSSAIQYFTGHGLAISSLPPRRKIPEFKVDSNLKRIFLEYGKSEFQSRGLKKGIAERVEIKDIRTTDLDGDGKPEYLISYFIIGEDVKRGEIDANMQYSLNVILEPTPTGFQQLFVHFPDPGIPEETHIYKFIDVIDLDGDGISEVVIQQVVSMNRWDYILLKKRGNVWEQVYEGAGGGC